MPSRWIAGLGALASLGALTWWLSRAPVEADAAPDCRPPCPPAQRCDAGRCIAAPGARAEARATRGQPRQAIPAAQREAEAVEPQLRGGGTLKEQRGWLDDDPIPRVLDAGALRPAKDALEPGRLQVELGEISDALDTCIESAAQREDPSLLRGQLRYELSVRSSGEVVGVNVRGNSRLRALGVQACARVTLFGHAFPAFEGTPIRVEGIYEL